MKKIICNDIEMMEFGCQLARLINSGLVIELVGDVGAGKTTLVKGLAKGLGVSEKIQSPTFSISRVYGCKNDLRLHHYDFYRLSDAGIMHEELMEVVSDEKNIIAIEWGEIVEDIIDDSKVLIKINAISDSKREIEITNLNTGLNLELLN